MAFTLNKGQSYVSAATAEIAFGDLANGVATAVVKLPAGSVVVGGFVAVDTAFVCTTAVLDLGDSVDANRYLAAADLESAALKTLTVTGEKAPSNAILATLTTTGTVTAGAVRLVVQYVNPASVQKIHG